MIVPAPITEIAAWAAPAATMIAAAMTAANAGARFTGWGFIVFTAGSIGWILTGINSGETNVIVSNGFLTLVNVIGAWRWLGRQSRYEALGTAAENAGLADHLDAVFSATGIAGRQVVSADGVVVGEAVEAIVNCRTGTIRHLVVRYGGIGGVGERIVALSHDIIEFTTDSINVRIDEASVKALPMLDEAHWPRHLDAAAP